MLLGNFLERGDPLGFGGYIIIIAVFFFRAVDEFD
jgi:hypothetical protein